MDDALRGIFSGLASGPPAPGGKQLPVSGMPPVRAGGEAWAAYQRGQEALRRGDWAGFGQAMRELEDVLRRMKNEGAPR